MSDLLNRRVKVRFSEDDRIAFTGIVVGDGGTMILIKCDRTGRDISVNWSVVAEVDDGDEFFLED